MGAPLLIYVVIFIAGTACILTTKNIKLLFVNRVIN